jgi:hypothetical protein
MSLGGRISYYNPRTAAVAQHIAYTFNVEFVYGAVGSGGRVRCGSLAGFSGKAVDRKSGREFLAYIKPTYF